LTSAQILRRINEEIEARRREGQALPPPPKTAIAGPEYFGMNQDEVVEAIEAMDPNHIMLQYWYVPPSLPSLSLSLTLLSSSSPDLII